MLCDYDNVVAQRDCLQEKLISIELWKESIVQNQNDMFGQLIGRYDYLCSSFASQQEQGVKDQKENEQLRCELGELTDKIQLQENVICELQHAKLELKNENCKLHKKVAELVENGKQLCSRLEQADIQLQESERELTRAQKASGDKKCERAELENRITEVQAQNTCLKSSMTELKIKMESTISKLQTEMNGLQCQLGSKSTEVAEIKRYLEDRQQKLDAQADRIGRLKKIIEELQEARLQDKCKTDEEMCELRAEVEAVGKELTAANRKVCDAQTEAERLRCQKDEQVMVIQRLESALDQQRQAAKKSKQCAELAAQKHTTEREQLNNQLKLNERKISLMKQDACELKRVIEDRCRQIKRLKAQIAELKCTSNQNNGCDQPDSFTSILDKHLEVMTDERESELKTQFSPQVEKDDWDFKSMANTMKMHLDDFSESFNEIKKLFKRDCDK
ncbi:uncharacterized protein LOC126845389 [Adelges cooleyi]|uniref:uncharacterized protein LOC126845389 n=1 Tax=Adelges cooleyi TaxID=133065 RepID=UPI00217F550D|nr:uncharacterized protein LOC126845389 [Adelges cooleyi]